MNLDQLRFAMDTGMDVFVPSGVAATVDRFVAAGQVEVTRSDGYRAWHWTHCLEPSVALKRMPDYPKDTWGLQVLAEGPEDRLYHVWAGEHPHSAVGGCNTYYRSLGAARGQFTRMVNRGCLYVEIRERRIPAGWSIRGVENGVLLPPVAVLDRRDVETQDAVFAAFRQRAGHARSTDQGLVANGLYR